MTERKLATIRSIRSVESIENADFIEVVKIDGWQCVTKKGEFKTGDRCVYFEVDSFLPIEDKYEFLRKSSYKKIKTQLDGGRSEGFRLKTVRLRKTLSQGLALPLDAFNSDPMTTMIGLDMDEGDDVTEMLGVEKYETPVPASLSGHVKGMFPHFIKKTDEERIQNLPEYFKIYKDTRFEITEKLDGSSMTVYFNDGEFGVCSRNLDLIETESNTFWKVARESKLEETLRGLGRNIALQGELVGEGIQKNPLKIKGHKFYLFNIWNIDTGQHFPPDYRVAIFLDCLFESISHVPVISNDDLVFMGLPDMEAMLEFAIGKSLVNNNVHREGVVFKSMSLLDGKVLSFKAISNKYLLKHGG